MNILLIARVDSELSIFFNSVAAMNEKDKSESNQKRILLFMELLIEICLLLLI